MLAAMALFVVWLAALGVAVQASGCGEDRGPGGSGKLRAVNLLDVTVIAAGFVLRVAAGAGAIGIPPSSWIILATGLLALLLGLGKRRGDLLVERAADRASLGQYDFGFIDLALAMLSAAVTTFYALFTVSEYSMSRFGSEHLYLTTFPVALAILRYLQVVLRGDFCGSPTEIVLRDRSVQALTLVWLVMFAALGDIGLL
jgi:decaprenyl-phosphate phosphoribosyltransferase